MPTLNAFPSRPQRDPPFEDEIEDWALPLGNVGGVQFHLSYSVFVAFAVLIGVIALVKDRSGNGDLPLVAIIGLGFWVSGWLVQLTVHCLFRFFAKIPMHSLTIGLLGIESRTRSWSAPAALVVASASLIGLVCLGTVFLSFEHARTGAIEAGKFAGVWAAPSFGLVSTDTMWLAGAWFCWIQALCQLFPLPKSLGRVMLASLVSICAGHVDETTQSWLAKRLVMVVAIITAVVALGLFATQSEVALRRTPILMILALLLWVSARSHDLFDMMVGFGSTIRLSEHEEPFGASEVSWTQSVRQSVRWRMSRRRFRQAIQQEHSEASDADRLDEVLELLHDNGHDALTREDQALLKRVSERLRKTREEDAELNVEE